MIDEDPLHIAGNAPELLWPAAVPGGDCRGHSRCPNAASANIWNAPLRAQGRRRAVPRRNWGNAIYTSARSASGILHLLSTGAGKPGSVQDSAAHASDRPEIP